MLRFLCFACIILLAGCKTLDLATPGRDAGERTETEALADELRDSPGFQELADALARIAIAERCASEDDPDRQLSICSELIDNADELPVDSEGEIALQAFGHAWRGAAYLRKGDIPRALEETVTAREMNADMMIGHLIYSQILAKQGKWDEALDVVGAQIEANPEIPTLYIARSVMRLGQIEENRFEGMPPLREADKAQLLLAIGDCSTALEYDPENADAYRYRGEAKYRTGDLSGALSDMSEAIRLDGEEGDAYSRRAAIYLDMSDPGSAAADLERAIELSPKEAFNYRKLALIRAGASNPALRDGREALRLANKALTMSKGLDIIMPSAAVAAAHAETGDFESAVTVQKKVLSSMQGATLLLKALKPGSSEALQMLKAEQQEVLEGYRQRRPFRLEGAPQS